MQQVNNAVQANPQRSLRAMLGMTGTTGTSSAGQMGDGFDMIFQQMMAGGMEGDDDLAALLMQLTGGLQKDSEKWGAQMAAEMLNSVPTLNPAVMTALVKASWAADEQNLADMVGRLQAMQGMGEVDLLEGERGITEVLEELVMPEEQTGKDQNQNQDFLDMLSAAWAKPKAETTRTISTQLDQSSIRAAKELMQRNKKEVVTPLLDVESLQADVDSGRFAPVGNSSLEEQFQVPSGEELAEQVKAGIFENVSQGKNEFVVRLKPEGIGEIEVRLSENKDKISLSIITNSPQTARLISNEILALQNALRPLNAEVQQVTTMAEAVAASQESTQYSAQNQMTDQGRQSHSQQESGRSGRSQRISGVTGVEDEFDEAVESGVAANDEILDTYI